MYNRLEDSENYNYILSIYEIVGNFSTLIKAHFVKCGKVESRETNDSLRLAIEECRLNTSRPMITPL